METEFVLCADDTEFVFCADDADVKQEVLNELDPLADNEVLMQYKVEEEVCDTGDETDRQSQSADWNQECDLVVKQEIIEVVEEMKAEMDEGTNSDVKDLKPCDLLGTSLSSSNCRVKQEKASPEAVHPGVAGENQDSQNIEKTEDAQRKLPESVVNKIHKLYKCSKCSYLSKSVCGIKNHLRIHNAVRVYRCELCNTLFTQSESLEQHKRVHRVGDDSRSLEDTGAQRKTYGIQGKTDEIQGKTDNILRKPYGTQGKSYGIQRKTDEIQRKTDNIQRKTDNILRKTDNIQRKTDNILRKTGSNNDFKVHKVGRTRAFKCEICDKLCARVSGLRQHKLLHTDERPFKCEICDKSFGLACSLYSHRRSHPETKPFKCALFFYAGKVKSIEKKKHLMCEVCGKMFAYNCLLRTHKLKHSGVKPYNCAQCGYGCFYSSRLKAHMRTHSKERCSSDKTQRKHTRSRGDQPRKCSFCAFVAKNEHGLTRHMVRHTTVRTYKCLVCDWSFNSYNSLYCHKRIHNGEKPYKCTECNYAGRQLYNLKIHLRTHTGERAYKCEVCDRRFSQSSHLEAHVRLHTGERPFKCSECSYAGNSQRDLRKHTLLHKSGKLVGTERLHYKQRLSLGLIDSDKCSLGKSTEVKKHTTSKHRGDNARDKNFSCSSGLSQRKADFPREKSYKCVQCDYASYRACSLEKHMQTHAGESFFQCAHCDFATNCKRKLRSHVSVHMRGKNQK